MGNCGGMIAYDRPGILKALKKRSSKVLGRNTVALLKHDGSIVVEYHGHPIVTFHANDDISLNDCGWRTVSTIDRLNVFSPQRVRIHRQNGDWVYTLGNDYPRLWAGSLTVTVFGHLPPDTDPNRPLVTVRNRA